MNVEVRKKRIKEIAVQIVTSQVAKGEVDGDDVEAVQVAVKEAADTAVAAYDAAEEFLCG